MSSAVNTPIFARFYPRAAEAMDRGGMAEHRRAALDGLSGRVIEVGAGNGCNFRHYPAGVEQVTAVEPEPRLRRAAAIEAERAPVPIEVVDGLAERIPAGDGAADAAVVSLVLCSVDDPDLVVRELYRVLKPGGQMRFLEHVRADSPALVRTQRLLDATVWPLLFGGCHTGRDTVRIIQRAGFDIERIDRFLWPEARTPFSFHVVGTARCPAFG